MGAQHDRMSRRVEHGGVGRLRMRLERSPGQTIGSEIRLSTKGKPIIRVPRTRAIATLSAATACRRASIIAGRLPLLVGSRRMLGTVLLSFGLAIWDSITGRCRLRRIRLLGGA